MWHELFKQENKNYRMFYKRVMFKISIRKIPQRKCFLTDKYFKQSGNTYIKQPGYKKDMDHNISICPY